MDNLHTELSSLTTQLRDSQQLNKQLTEEVQRYKRYHDDTTKHNNDSAYSSESAQNESRLVQERVRKEKEFIYFNYLLLQEELLAEVERLTVHNTELQAHIGALINEKDAQSESLQEYMQQCNEYRHIADVSCEFILCDISIL
jgi:hypothetical protein